VFGVRSGASPFVFFFFFLCGVTECRFRERETVICTNDTKANPPRGERDRGEGDTMDQEIWMK